MSDDRPKFGPTGKFPRGKLYKDDKGEVVVGIAHDDEGLVHINLGTPTEWLAMPPEEAREFARVLALHADHAEARKKEEPRP